ncbi:HAD-IIIA family hydrolase [Jiella endophytica]|uniref:D,D-heptose 1,7-bisphosphate phosphatase n=1 Tax=Jiella endophytica TaxID=2558362 RepID=A0A4Y8RLH5_9HYPH|nr:HAD-IIIA family hydrolase [Jiella endophytica]TFF23311.1 HAD-IIIA family hydrolase [Jiella endophytica]
MQRRRESEMSGVPRNVPVAILLGGRGVRLGLTDRPKPMVEFLGRPLLERTVAVLRNQGFTNLVFLTGHLGNVIADHFGDGSRFGVSIAYSHESEPLGTARATAAAVELLGDEFVLLYGDTVFDVDLARLVKAGRANGGDGTLLVHPNDHPFDSDLVVTDLAGRITAFRSKPHPPGLLARNLVNAGLYYMRPTLFDAIPDGADLWDWGRDVFGLAVGGGKQLHAYKTSEYIKDIGTPDRLAKAERAVTTGLVEKRSLRSRQRAVFFDRDGVLNREIDGVHEPAALELLDGVGEVVHAINASQFLSVVITNQPDLAKGFFGFEDLDLVHAELERQLAAQGAYLDAVYFCPHHPERGFAGEVAELKVDCDCRKPRPGMLHRAAEELNIDLSASFFLGDRMSDMAAGKAVGATTIFMENGSSTAAPPADGQKRAGIDHVAPNIVDAWRYICEEAS